MVATASVPVTSIQVAISPFVDVMSLKKWDAV